MALGAAMATGKPQAYAVVPGPGLLNSTAALLHRLRHERAGDRPDRPDPAAAHRQRPRPSARDPRPARPDAPLTKWAERIQAPQEAPRLVEQAFRQLHTGRPQPGRRWNARSTSGAPAPRSRDGRGGRPRPAGRSTTRRSTRPPSCWARPSGRSSSSAAARRTPAPRSPRSPRCWRRRSPPARWAAASCDARHPLAVNLPVAHRLWSDADVVLAVGTRFFIQQMTGASTPTSRSSGSTSIRTSIDRHAQPDGRHRRRRRAAAAAPARRAAAAQSRRATRAPGELWPRARWHSQTELAAAAAARLSAGDPRGVARGRHLRRRGRRRSATRRASAIRSTSRAPSSRPAIRARSAGATPRRSAPRSRGPTAGREHHRRRRLHVQRAGAGDRGAPRHRRDRGRVRRRRLRQRQAHRRSCATATA